jgi:hypothetical protein
MIRRRFGGPLVSMSQLGFFGKRSAVNSHSPYNGGSRRRP